MRLRPCVQCCGVELKLAGLVATALLSLAFAGAVFAGGGAISAVALCLCLGMLMCAMRAARPSIGALQAASVRKAIEQQCPALVVAAAPSGATGRVGIDVADVEALGDESCVICMEPRKDGDRCRALPCDHAFHAACIDTWWLREAGRRRLQLHCPLCRAGACRLAPAHLRPVV